jgi:hypothetical protein
MPEFTVKEVRLPELHMPELKREEIVRSLAGIRLPEVDLAKARDIRIKVPTVTLTSSDVGKILAVAATATRFVRPAPRRRLPFLGSVGRRNRLPSVRIVQPRRRPRWRLAALIAVVGFGLWAILRRPDVQRRLQAGAREARERFETMRAESLQPSDGNGTATSPAMESSVVDETPTATDLAAGVTPTDGLAAPDEASSPMFEESSQPA